MKLIYKRIFLALGLFIIAVSLSGYLIYKTYESLGEDLVRRTALLIADSVNEVLANATDKNLESLTNSEKRSLRRLMSSLTSEEGNIIHILLISDKMRILLSSDRSVEGREYTTPEELANLQGDQPKVITKIWSDSIRVVDVIIPLKNSENYVYSYLRLVLSQKGIQNFFADISVIFIPLVIVFGLLIVFTIYFISRAYAKPLESIEQMAQNIASGDYSYRINYERKDEFTDTFSAIDKSLEKVSVLSEGYKKAEKRINALLQVVDESIILLDHNKEIISYNEACVELFQCPVEILFESHFRQIQLLNQDLKNLITNVYDNEKNIVAREMILWMPDGRDVLARVTTFVFKENDKLNGVLLTIKDQKLINELQRNLQRSMKFGVIANLASSISHEIKNPLSSMAIHAEILNVRFQEMEIENRDVIEKSLDVLQNEVKRLNRIISQFFNLARVKKTDLNLININKVIEDVITLVQQQAIERNIKINLSLNNEVDHVYGDPDQLKQVFLNIILNAFQAIHHNGQTDIRTRQEGSSILVEIEDNGAGMSHEVKERLFELYFTTKHDGGGIGMAICKNIVEAHEGKITFDSTEGKGTIFTIALPRKDKTTQINIKPAKNASTSKVVS
ncbi:MAG: HAMP domain-containing protein [Calditrichaeota bacterium]|nr:HAMP domain-containing protein [Calditrichota bacterium]